MAMDPEELVTLTDHGTMKLRSAVVRAMILPAKERKRAKIVREGEPAILIFKQIRNLGAKWADSRVGPPETALVTAPFPIGHPAAARSARPCVTSARATGVAADSRTHPRPRARPAP